MKKRKLLILLAAVLSFALLLTSCDLFADNGAAETTESASEVSKKPDDGVSAEAVDHEIRKYFELKSEIEAKTWTEVSRIDGDIVAYDEDNNLIAVKTLDITNSNQIEETVEVYDLNTGSVILHDRFAGNYYGVEDENRTIYTVEIECPVIRVGRQYNSEGSDPTYYVEYYLYNGNTVERIHTTDSNDYELTEYYNGLVSCKAGDKVFWIDRNGEIIRTVDAIIANGYTVDSFNAEYQGYLYAWNGESIQIFNRSGMCCVDHKFEGLSNNISVLDNGNVLIQSTTLVTDPTEEYNVILGGARVLIKSQLLSFTDGTVKDVDLDYVAMGLISAYDTASDAPLKLANGRHNQAVVHRIANKSISLYSEYVVINNDLEIEYSIKNTTNGVDLSELEVLNENFYVAPVYSGGAENNYIFDLDGNAVAVCNAYEVTAKYIVTDNAIYDYGMNKVYDFSANGFELEMADTCSANVYLSKYNYKTGEYEYFVFNGNSATPTLIADEVETFFDGAGYGVYAIEYDSVATVYNADGKALFVLSDRYNDMLFDGILVVEFEFEGKAINYILK